MCSLCSPKNCMNSKLNEIPHSIFGYILSENDNQYTKERRIGLSNDLRVVGTLTFSCLAWNLSESQIVTWTSINP